MVENAAYVQLLKEFGDPAEEGRKQAAFAESARYVERDDVRSRYADRWVAVVRSTVIASADTLEALDAQLRLLDAPRDELLVKHVETQPPTLIL
jgi:hypothetical protein